MKKTSHLFSALLLGAGLSLSLGSCQDTDLDNGGTNGDGGTEQNDALAKKYQALQTLLGSLADVDSLPDNWNSADYTVAPTVGIVNNDADPHVRYVVTTSQAEADRIYRSYLSKDVTATPSNDSWQMDGIGSMQFKLENSADHFATLKVNVQQLPSLEEVRFVSEEALGSNGLISPSGTYYSFGDVVCQIITSTSERGNTIITPTFWVCTRPCSMSPKRRQSHWCTFQLVPAGDKKQQNYLEIDDGDDGFNELPTQLALKKSDAEQQIQNFFNVLRIMANPNVALSDNYTGIDEISSTNKYEQASFNTLRNTSFMWDYLDLWNKEYQFIDEKNNNEFTGSIVNEKYNLDKDLRDILGDVVNENLLVNAYYYGYTKNFFAKGDYTVYNLQLSTPAADSPFLNVKKQTAYVYSNGYFFFTNYESGNANNGNEINYGSDEHKGDYQFIVKYRTGGELEGLSHSSVDKDPSQSFTKRQSTNQIYDVLVSGNYAKKEAYSTYTEQGEEKKYLPFFCIGDIVSTTLKDKNGEQFKGFQYCVRSANDTYSTNNDDWKKKASFIGFYDDNTLNTADLNAKYKVTPSNEDIAVGLYQILQSKLFCNDKAHEVFTEEYELYKNNTNKGEAEDEASLYLKSLKKLDTKVSNNYATFNVAQENDERTATLTIMVNSENYTIKLTRTKQEGMTYNSYSITKEANPKVQLKELCFYSYEDKYAFRDEYSEGRDLVVSNCTGRYELKKELSDVVKKFMNSVEFQGF